VEQKEAGEIPALFRNCEGERGSLEARNFLQDCRDSFVHEESAMCASVP